MVKYTFDRFAHFLSGQTKKRRLGSFLLSKYLYPFPFLPELPSLVVWVLFRDGMTVLPTLYILTVA